MGYLAGMSSTQDKKSGKVDEIIRLQNAIFAATRAVSREDVNPLINDPAYIALVDEYLTFLMHFVGTAGYEWTEERLTRMDRICEVTTNIRSKTALMKIPEDMIPPVALREMLIGDDKGPWMIPVGSPRIREFMARYPFLMTRMTGA